ncbi:hypothetical protein [Microbacterium imperiale]|uniref:Uncharacterized protein n=1 Tax=Microbacterium imperiale TaxID=33884 RepID=A0A9W6HHL2_9MICO|nr:hypothetical protein [Microbacterium imperiale]MBP2420900.1 hypothetical protein [Microbacterium imperiale]MDS0199985.1 hypothetical protein [Microbacterium imperiale]BFE41242.1 hypothetical protein GCM10017544_21980 [Microbacterium imperiale]GLJ80193.1 hypothetical protein GCM10017586_18760 [Microbacterium imperiale]
MTTSPPELSRLGAAALICLGAAVALAWALFSAAHVDTPREARAVAGYYWVADVDAIAGAVLAVIAFVSRRRQPAAGARRRSN